MQNKLFSIITITKNPNLIWLKATIQSVVNQDFDNYEYIIVDASSESVYSEIENIILHYADKVNIKLLKQQTKGIWSAFEEAYANCKGQYVGVINSDDYYAKNNVFSNVSKQLSTSESDFIYGNSLRVDSLGNDLYEHKPLFFLSKRNYDFFVFNISHHTLFFKKDILERIPFVTSESNAVDLDFMRRLYQSEYIGSYINERIACFRIHDNNFSSTYSKEDTLNLFEKWNSMPRFMFYFAKSIIFMFNPKYFIFFIKRKFNSKMGKL
ncbi:MAG: glycosyltransferase [Colwellia sp.]|nr:glycosyltransferase [Colwellia sp.]